MRIASCRGARTSTFVRGFGVGAIVFVLSSGCAVRGARNNPPPDAARRKDVIARARVWSPTDVSAMNVRRGPDGRRAPAPEALVDFPVLVRVPPEVPTVASLRFLGSDGGSLPFEVNNRTIEPVFDDPTEALDAGAWLRPLLEEVGISVRQCRIGVDSKPVFLFVNEASYRKVLDLEEIVGDVVERELDTEFRAAFAEAMRTGR